MICERSLPGPARRAPRMPPSTKGSRLLVRAWLGLTLSTGGAWAADAQAPAFTTHPEAIVLPRHEPARLAHQRALLTCMKLSGNQKDVCMAAARLELTQAEARAFAQDHNDARAASKGRLAVAQAEYELAVEMCQDRRDPDQRACVSDAAEALKQAQAQAGGLEAPEARPLPAR